MSQPTDSQNEEPAEWPDIIGAGMGLGKETHMKQEPQPAGQSVEGLANKLADFLKGEFTVEDTNEEGNVFGAPEADIAARLLPLLQSFATSQQQARELLEARLERLRSIMQAKHTESGETVRGLKAAVKTLRGALEESDHEVREFEIEQALESTKEFA